MLVSLAPKQRNTGKKKGTDQGDSRVPSVLHAQTLTQGKRGPVSASLYENKEVQPFLRLLLTCSKKSSQTLAAVLEEVLL